MNWFTWTLIGLFTLPILKIMQKKLMHDSQHLAVGYTILFQVIPGIVLISISIILGYGIPNFINGSLHWIIGILAFTMGTFFYYKALTIGEISEITITTSTRTIWTILFSYIFLKEPFNTITIIGTIIILFSIFILQYRGKKFIINKAFYYAIASALTFAVGFVNEPFLLKYNETLQVIAWEFLLVGIFQLIILKNAIPQIKEILLVRKQKLLLPTLLFIGLPGVANLMAVNLGGELSIITPISQFGKPLTIILAYFFLKETDHKWNKIIGIILSIIGVLIIKLYA